MDCVHRDQDAAGLREAKTGMLMRDQREVNTGSPQLFPADIGGRARRLPMRFISMLGCVLLLAGAVTAPASTVSQREYKRGYTDCLAGRWDENQHGESYKRGCRAAEDKLKKSGKSCPPDVSQADRYKYPGCK